MYHIYKTMPMTKIPENARETVDWCYRGNILCAKFLTNTVGTEATAKFITENYNQYNNDPEVEYHYVHE